MFQIEVCRIMTTPIGAKHQTGQEEDKHCECWSAFLNVRKTGPAKNIKANAKGKQRQQDIHTETPCVVLKQQYGDEPGGPSNPNPRPIEAPQLGFGLLKVVVGEERDLDSEPESQKPERCPDADEQEADVVVGRVQRQKIQPNDAKASPLVGKHYGQCQESQYSEEGRELVDRHSLLMVMWLPAGRHYFLNPISEQQSFLAQPASIAQAPRAPA